MPFNSGKYYLLKDIYYKPIMKWYIKVWYILTFRKNRIKEFEQFKPLLKIKN